MYRFCCKYLYMPVNFFNFRNMENYRKFSIFMLSVRFFVGYVSGSNSNFDSEWHYKHPLENMLYFLELCLWVNLLFHDVLQAPRPEIVGQFWWFEIWLQYCGLFVYLSISLTCSNFPGVCFWCLLVRAFTLCEGDEKTLTCSENTLISIQNALYGLRNEIDHTCLSPMEKPPTEECIANSSYVIEVLQER